jgi:hypothetical protein
MSKTNSRLLKYRGKEGVPADLESLNLAANIDDAAAAIDNAVNVVNRDLTEILQEFLSVVTNLSTISANVENLINNGTENTRYLGKRTKSILDNLKLLQDQYKNVLAARYWTIRPLEKNDDPAEREKTI